MDRSKGDTCRNVVVLIVCLFLVPLWAVGWFVDSRDSSARRSASTWASE